MLQKTMKTWICTTLASFFGPMQGAARLYAYLKKQGHDVSFKDLNQDAYFALLSREHLEPILERSKYILESVARSKFLREDINSILLHSSNGAIKQLLARGTMSDSPVFGLTDSKIKHSNIFYALLSEKEFVLSEIEQARNALDRYFLSLSPEEFLAHFQTLLCGKALIDVAHFPAQLDFGFGFHGTAYGPFAGDIIRAVDDERHNFLIPYYRNQVMPLLNKEHPDIVGISITHTSEFIPAFTLANMIKSEYPQIHISLGGATLTEVSHRRGHGPVRPGRAKRQPNVRLGDPASSGAPGAAFDGRQAVTIRYGS